MSACRCSERTRPFARELPPGSNERPCQWFVIRRNESCSAFNGYRSEWSDFSTVACRVCGAHWRTKAAFPDHLQNSDYFPHHAEPRVDPWDTTPLNDGEGLS